MQCIVMCATGMCVFTATYNFFCDKLLILDAYHSDPLLMSASMWESVVIFQSQRVFVSKKVWEKLY